MPSEVGTITSLPNQNILLRGKEGIEIYELPSNTNSQEEGKLRTLVKGHCKFHSLSQDGTKVVTFVTGKGVVIYNVAEDRNEAIPLEGNTERVACAYFSPLGAFIATWERYNKEEPNLKLWSASTGMFLKSWVCRSTPKRLMSEQRQQQTSCGAYNVLQWTLDEKLMMFGGTGNQVVVYSGHMFETVATKIVCENMRSFSISPRLDGYLLATFIPEVKGKPGRVSLFSVTLSSDANACSSKELIGKSFFQTEECNVHWSPLGDTMLVVTQMTVDRTGTSYYGSANVYLFSMENAIQVTLPSSKNAATVGMVHDIAWNPNVLNKPPTFAMVSGPMPAMTSLHDGNTSEAIFLFGNSHRNTIVWAPHGRFLAVGGFGNLAGNFDFWDRNKGKRIPRYASPTCNELVYGNSASSAAVGYAFSPNSRMFMISTTSPRMNVENGIQIFRYNGEGPLQLPTCLNGKYAPNKLYYAEFVPALDVSIYPDRPQTPLPKRLPADANITAASTASTAAPSAGTGGRYVPPSMRNSSKRSGNLAEKMRLEREASTAGPVKITRQNKSSIPGLAPTKSIPGLAPVSTTKPRKPKNKQGPKSEATKPKPPVETPKPPPPEPIQQPPQDPEKRAKKIKKLLKQIDELKISTKELNEDQKCKIESYDKLCAELKDLGF